MPHAETNDGSVYYEADGTPLGEPVVLIEGLGYGRWMWNWQAARLVDEFRLVRPDNRGTGKSDASEGPYSVAEMAADLEAVLADAGIRSAHLVGADMGGMIAQRYALDYDRAASLALFCTSPGGDAGVDLPPDVSNHLSNVPEEYDERERIRHRMEPAVSETFFEDEERFERIVDWRLEQDASESARLAQSRAVDAFDAAAELSDLGLPTLILHGTDDRILPVGNADALAERLPSADVRLIDGGSHLCFLERPAVVNEHLSTFLNGVDV